MATTWIGDAFRGTGEVPGSAAPIKEAGTGDWAASPGQWTYAGETVSRSATGAVIGVSGTTGYHVQFYALGSGAVGTGVVCEAAVFGGGMIILMVDSVLYSLGLNRVDGFSGPDRVELYDGVTPSYYIDATRSWPTKTVLRLEVDATGMRGYVDGTLRVSSGVTALSGAEVMAAGLNSGTMLPPTAPGSTLMADYIHVVRNTTSGALGSPTPSSGAASTLPMLTLDAGAWNHGTASYELPQLYAIPAPIAPTFWAAKVGVREA